MEFIPEKVIFHIFFLSHGSLRKVCGRVCLRKGYGRDLLDSCKSNNIKHILVDTFKCKVADAVRTKNMKTVLRGSSRKLGLETLGRGRYPLPSRKHRRTLCASKNNFHYIDLEKE